MKTVNIHNDVGVWHCDDCGEENVIAMKRADLDLTDPDNAELLEGLVESGDIELSDDGDLMDSEYDDGDDDEADEEYQVEEMNFVMFYFPNIVQCCECGTSFKANPLSIDDSFESRQWKGKEEIEE